MTTSAKGRSRAGVAPPEGAATPNEREAGVGVHHYLDDVRWNADGLVAAIAQDATSLKVLTLAWMNRDALERTDQTREAHYFSRSRNKLWRKGESSGHVQHVREVRLDCDGDAIVLLVEQVGGIACHTGHERCFFRTLADGAWHDVEPVLKDPKAIYGDG